MTYEAAPVFGRGRSPHEDAFPENVACNAYRLALLYAARDAHRTACDRDAVACDTCRAYAEAIGDAKGRRHRTRIETSADGASGGYNNP